MEDVKEERQWRESMGRRAERIMREFGIDADVDADGEGGLRLTVGWFSGSDSVFFFFFLNGQRLTWVA